MKKKVLIGVAVILFVLIAVAVSENVFPAEYEEAYEHIYPRTGIVTEVNYEADTVTFTDCAGLSWVLDSSEDWGEGDLASCVMYDNGTPNTIFDDVILMARYAGMIEDGNFWISGK